MKKPKTYTISESTLRVCLKMAARSHTSAIKARRAKKAAPIGSWKKDDARMDETRDYYYARGMLMVLSLLDGTEKKKRLSNPRPRPKTTPTAKATA